jgi:hypothetical protein
MESWVAPHLTGGIGNRLFEFAAALGAAEKWGKPSVFYRPMIQKNDHGPVDNILKLFPNVPVLTTEQSYASYPEPNGHVFKYTPFPQSAPGDRTVILGYRQSEKYFPAEASLLKPDWSPFLDSQTKQVLLSKHGFSTDASKSRTWFLHIRLGDYKVLPHHQINIAPYYEKCLNEVPKGSHIILFSDELNLCAGWFAAICSQRSLEPIICMEADEIKSLWLMSQCHGGAIVANSTFSWWGAYFARQEVGEAYKAFYPSVWGQGLPPAYDVVPEWGIKVEV